MAVAAHHTLQLFSSGRAYFTFANRPLIATLLVGDAESQPSPDHGPAVFGLQKPFTSFGTKRYFLDVPVSYTHGLRLTNSVMG